MAISDRMIRASRGEVALYEEVEHDPAATTQAITVVVIAAVASGVGTALGSAIAGRPAAMIGALIVGVIGALLGWVVFAGATYLIGTRLFNADASLEEVLRTLGFAYSPYVASILGFIPILGAIIRFVLFFLTIYLAFVAIRSALDIDNGKTIATMILAIIAVAIVLSIILFPLIALFAIGSALM